ncbi:MAG TPA: FAD-dependent oxidoreductase, partial [Longimicrobiaceae bacterium]|nr:FAD-dependent oxidoreductase [Longimicrobiaceae bacterium]
MIAIVGAGLTGLALAHELARLGAPHQVLEATGRPGGVIRSGRVEGHLLEWGPQRARMTAQMAALVRELGLGGEVVTAPRGLPLFVYRRGRLRRVPFSPAQLLRTDLLSPAAKLRLLAEPLTAGPRPGESVAGYLSRKLGRAAYEDLAGPLYGGLYASDPADMRVD